MELVSPNQQKEAIIDYLKTVIKKIDECDYVVSAKVEVTLNNDVMYGKTNYRDYDISIRVKE